jgi:hypothetical protein
MTDDELIAKLRPSWMPRNHQTSIKVKAANRIEELLEENRELRAAMTGEPVGDWFMEGLIQGFTPPEAEPS